MNRKSFLPKAVTILFEYLGGCYKEYYEFDFGQFVIHQLASGCLIYALYFIAFV